MTGRKENLDLSWSDLFNRFYSVLDLIKVFQAAFKHGAVTVMLAC